MHVKCDVVHCIDRSDNRCIKFTHNSVLSRNISLSNLNPLLALPGKIFFFFFLQMEEELEINEVWEISLVVWDEVISPLNMM